MMTYEKHPGLAGLQQGSLYAHLKLKTRKLQVSEILSTATDFNELSQIN